MDIKNAKVGVVAAVGIISSLAGVATTWAVNNYRLDQAEKKIERNEDVLNEHSKLLVRIDAQYREILWRLRRIDHAVTEEDNDDAKVSPR